MIPSLRLSLTFVFFLVLASLTVSTASADEPPFYWEYINVDIEVQENGDMLVTETQKYVFTGPHTNQRYRYIPMDKVDGIDSIQVFDQDWRLLAVDTGIQDNEQWIRWSREVSPPESHIFTLKYRVRGGLHIHDDGDQVFWKALFKDRDAPIDAGMVTVHLPFSMSGKIISFKSFGVPADARQVDEQTVEFVSRGALSPGKELEVQVTFPHGVLEVPAPEWRQKRSGLLGPVRTLLYVMGFAIAMIVLRRIAGRTYRWRYEERHGTPPERQDVPVWVWYGLGPGPGRSGSAGGFGGGGGG